MFQKTLLKQTKGSKLQFKPESHMGFTTGENHISVQVQSYAPTNSSVSLSFFTGGVPAINSYGEYQSMFLLKSKDLPVGTSETINPIIVAEAVKEAITHLKSFNPGCDFEVVQFEKEPRQL